MSWFTRLFKRLNWYMTVVSNTKFELLNDTQEGRIDDSCLPIEYQVLLSINGFSLNEMNVITETYNLDSDGWNLIGLAYRDMQRFPLAEEAFEKSIQINPKNPKPYENLLSLYLLTKNFHNYVKTIQFGKANSVPNSYILYQYGRYKYYKRNYEQAKQIALSAISENVRQYEELWLLAIFSLLKLSLKSKDNFAHIEQAKAMLVEALELFPDSELLTSLNRKVFRN